MGLYVGGTAAANELDDYEEGLFTPYMAYSPTSNDPAYSDQVGQYVKIGKLVTFQARVNLTSAGKLHSKFDAHNSALFDASKKLWPNAIPPSMGIVESFAPFI